MIDDAYEKMVEQRCRHICVMRGIDPDATGFKVSDDGWNGWKVGDTYKLWEWWKPIVEMLVDKPSSLLTELLKQSTKGERASHLPDDAERINAGHFVEVHWDSMCPVCKEFNRGHPAIMVNMRYHRACNNKIVLPIPSRR